MVFLQSLETTIVFKSYDKSSGVSLRSSKVCYHTSPYKYLFSSRMILQMKTPMTLGQKKAKTIEQLLEELGISWSPFLP